MNYRDAKDFAVLRNAYKYKKIEDFILPTYRFENTKTGEMFEQWMYMSEREEFLQENPDLKQIPTGFAAVSEIGDWKNKTSDGWNDVLRKVSTVPGSTVKPYK